MGCYHIQHLSHRLYGAESCLRKWKIGRERFFTPTRVLGSPDEQWCEAGGAAATSKGKSGGRMAGEEKSRRGRKRKGRKRRKKGKEKEKEKIGKDTGITAVRRSYCIMHFSRNPNQNGNKKKPQDIGATSSAKKYNPPPSVN